MGGGMLTKLDIELPEWDARNMRPKTKMPDCPACGEDELGMLCETRVYCYMCGLDITIAANDDRRD